MIIHVRTVVGQVLNIEVNRNDRLESLKKKIQEYEILNRKVPPNQQRIMFEGKQLDDNEKTFEEYGISDQSTVHLVLNLKCSGTFNVVGNLDLPIRLGWKKRTKKGNERANLNFSKTCKRVFKEIRRNFKEVKKTEKKEDEKSFEILFSFEGGLENLSWSARIKGPRGTPYEGYAFRFLFSYPLDYPFKPPKIRKERFYHFAMSEEFDYVSINSETWSPSMNTKDILCSIYKAMEDPTVVSEIPKTNGCTCGYNEGLLKLFLEDRKKYDENCREFTEKHNEKE